MLSVGGIDRLGNQPLFRSRELSWSYGLLATSTLLYGQAEKATSHICKATRQNHLQNL